MSISVQPMPLPDKPHMKILLSYWYYKNVDLDALLARYFTHPMPEIFADSGAYSAANFNKVITAEMYGDWLDRWKHLFSCCSNLDVKGSRSGSLTAAINATAKNQHYLEDRGLHPIPVYHGGEPFSLLEDYIADYTYIALGGMAASSAQHNKQRMGAWMVKIFRLAAGKAVYHGFGQTNWEYLQKFPFYTVDSSTWGSGFRFGYINVFDDTKGKWIKFTFKDKAGWFKHAALIRSYGFEPAEFADGYERGRACTLSAMAYMKCEAYLQKLHGVIAPPDRPTTKGPLVYLADAQPKNWYFADRGIKIFMADSTHPKLDTGRAYQGMDEIWKRWAREKPVGMPRLEGMR